MVVAAKCAGCSAKLYVHPPVLEQIVRQLESNDGKAMDRKTSLMLAAVTPIIPMMPANVMDGLPTVMRIYCPDCTREIDNRAVEKSDNGRRQSERA